MALLASLLLGLSLLPTAAYAQASSQAAEDESEPSGGPVIDRFAGGGFGEGGPAVAAALVGPTGMAADGQGNLYIADGYGDRLLKVSAEGTVTGVANVEAQPRMCNSGPSCPGGRDLESVDGLPARDATIHPYQVAVKRDGDLLVLDRQAGNGVGCSLHRIDAETGIVDTLIESPQGCNDYQRNPVDGPIESATMARPSGGMVTGPDGSLYFVDQRQVDDENGPKGTVIRRIDPSFTTVSTVAGGGAQVPADGVAAVDAQIQSGSYGSCPGPGGPNVAVDAEGLLHFTCYTRIWRVEESGALRLVAGGGNFDQGRRDGEDAVGAYFSEIGGMAIVGEGGLHAPGIYVTEGGVIRRVSPDGKAYTFDDTPDLWGWGQSHAMVVDSAGRLFAAGGTGILNDAPGVNEVWGEHVGKRVFQLDPDGTPVPAVGNGLWTYYGQDDGTPAAEAGFGQFSEIATDAAGNVYVRDSTPEGTLNKRAVVRRIDANTGQVTRVAGNPETGPLGECRPEVSGPALDAVICNRSRDNGIAVDSVGNVYLTAGYGPCRACLNPGYSAIYRVDAQTGTIDDIWSCGGVAVKDLPTCVDGSSPNGLYVDDSDTVFFSQSGGRVNRLDAVGPAWVATTVADVRVTGSSEFGDLTGDAQGRLYVADDNRVYRVEPGPGDPTGLVWTVTPVAGTGERGFSGDGGPATEAQLFWAHGVAVDAGGNLLIAEYMNMRVRRVDADTGIIDTIAGDGACCSTNGVSWLAGAYSGDGGPALEASLTAPTALTVLPDGRLLITDSRKLRVLDSTDAP